MNTMVNKRDVISVPILVSNEGHWQVKEQLQYCAGAVSGLRPTSLEVVRKAFKGSHLLSSDLKSKELATPGKRTEGKNVPAE